MKNILYHYSSQQTHTGSPRVLMGVIEGVDRSRFAPFFLGEEGELSRELVKRGCRLLPGESRQVSRQSWLGNLVNVCRLLRMLLVYKISLVHLNQLGWNSELALAAKLLGIPIFFHIHNHERMHKGNINCRIGSKYLYVSKALAQACYDGWFPRQQPEILYNPIQVDTFGGGRSIRRELNLPEGVPVVGTVAQVCQRKGIDVVLDTAAKVLKKLPETRFLIAGPDGLGESSFASKMRSRAETGDLAGKVLFLGPREDIPNILASLDLFFLPTRSEPFGLVFVEAMAARVPVVASKVGGIPEIVPSDDYGICLELDADLFAQNIVRLLKDPKLRWSISEAGVRRARAEFDAPVFNRKMNNLYLQATNS
jgi:glycosyltransferase involved in cell wall biosynthesis